MARQQDAVGADEAAGGEHYLLRVDKKNKVGWGERVWTALHIRGHYPVKGKLTQDQLDRVERAIIARWGFAWKSWQEEAQVIWNALAEERR
jgi:hypothetical protein